MRGKDSFPLLEALALGITPAYAGKSVFIVSPPFLFLDHPRLCGEKTASSSLLRFQPGSPPPMRGKATTRQPILTTLRITPAYAGKSFFRLWQWYIPQDHPRLCGEKFKRLPICLTAAGSPPPMRGKDFLGHALINFYRITPAYAGKRHRSGTRYSGCKDHPRLCGEKPSAFQSRTQ